jgi:hypothetical protein
VDGPSQMLRSLQFALDENLVDHDFRCHIGEFTPLLRLDLFSHWIEVPLHSVHADEMQSMRENDLECLASTAVNTPGTMFPDSSP